MLRPIGLCLAVEGGHRGFGVAVAGGRAVRGNFVDSTQVLPR